MIQPMVSLHETAIIDEGAILGAGTRVWHHCHIRGGAQVGENCSLGKNVYIDEGVRIGDRVKIQNNVSIYAGVTIQDDVFLGPSCVFTNDRQPRATADQWTPHETLVRRGASVGANATIVCGVTIGEWAMIGAGSVVIRDVAGHTLVVGNPARAIGHVCRCGAVLDHEADHQQAAPGGCPACGRAQP